MLLAAIETHKLGVRAYGYSYRLKFELWHLVVSTQLRPQNSSITDPLVEINSPATFGTSSGESKLEHRSWAPQKVKKHSGAPKCQNSNRNARFKSVTRP